MDVASVNNNWVDSYLDALVSCCLWQMPPMRFIAIILPQHRYSPLQQRAFHPRDLIGMFSCS
jgi:hypothetical protein